MPEVKRKRRNSVHDPALVAEWVRVVSLPKEDPEPTAADKETKEILERIAKWKKKKEE